MRADRSQAAGRVVQGPCCARSAQKRRDTPQRCVPYKLLEPTVVGSGTPVLHERSSGIVVAAGAGKLLFDSMYRTLTAADLRCNLGRLFASPQ